MRRKQIISVLLVICFAVTLLSVTAHAAAATITAGSASDSAGFNIGEASCTVTALSASATVDGGDITLGAGAAVKISYISAYRNTECTVTNASPTDTAAFTYTNSDGFDHYITLKSGMLTTSGRFEIKVGNRVYNVSDPVTIAKNTDTGANANDAVITASDAIVSFDSTIVKIGDGSATATFKTNADTLTYISSVSPYTGDDWSNNVTDWAQVQGKTDTWQAPLITYYGFVVDNIDVTSLKLQDKVGDDWSWKLTPADGSKAYHTLTLKNATISGKAQDSYGSDLSAAVYYYGETPVVIELIGENKLTAGTNSDSWSAAIETHNADVTVKGSGSLYAAGNKATGSGSSSHNSAGINIINGNLVIENAKVTATGDDAERLSYGINSYRSIEIKGNAVVKVSAKNAVAGAHGLHADGNITIGGNARVDAFAESADTSESIAINCYGNINITDNAAVKASAKSMAIMILNDINIRQGDFSIRTVNGGNDTTVKRGDFAIDEWYEVTYFEMPYYAVDVTAENGSVTGGGSYALGSNVTLGATANSGYRFVKWTKDGADAGTDATLSFTVSAHHNVVAVFEKETSVPGPTPTPTPDDPSGNTPGDTSGNTPGATPPSGGGNTPSGNTPSGNTPVGNTPGTTTSGGSKPSLLPDTGDNSNVALWFIVLIVSGAGIAAMILQKNKLI